MTDKIMKGSKSVTSKGGGQFSQLDIDQGMEGIKRKDRLTNLKFNKNEMTDD